MSKLFEGIKVLDFSANFAGPDGTAMLADFGAEVIQIERPGRGDDCRHMPPFDENGSSIWFWWNSRGKKSVEIDMADPEGQALLHEMVKDADVIVETNRPGVMKKLNMDYETVSKIKPDIIYCAVTGFGQYGPMSSYACYDAIAQARSGLVDLTGPVDGVPYRNGTGIGDITSSFNLAFAVSAALFHRERTGEGQFIDISMCEALMSMNVFVEPCDASAFKDYTRAGNHTVSLTPYGIYEGKDGQMLMICTANNNQWLTLCDIMGLPQYKDDPETATIQARATNLPKVLDIVQGWLKTFDDINDAANIMIKHSIACAKVAKTRELLTDEHLLARGSIIDLPTPPSVAAKGRQTVKARGPWIKMNNSPAEMKAGTDLGQDNMEYMTKYMSAEKAEALQAKWHNK